MLVREFRESDLDELRRIHAKFFANEFSLPDFLREFLCVATIEDNDGIVTIGGVRNIAEVVAVTNQDRSVRVRREGLWNLYNVSRYIAGLNNHTQIHAFVQDEKWLHHLVDFGFRPTKGKSLVTEI